MFFVPSASMDTVESTVINKPSIFKNVPWGISSSVMKDLTETNSEVGGIIES